MLRRDRAIRIVADIVRELYCVPVLVGGSSHLARERVNFPALEPVRPIEVSVCGERIVLLHGVRDASALGQQSLLEFLRARGNAPRVSCHTPTNARPQASGGYLLQARLFVFLLTSGFR